MGELLLRIFYRMDRRLLGKLSRCACFGRLSTSSRQYENFFVAKLETSPIVIEPIKPEEFGDFTCGEFIEPVPDYETCEVAEWTE